MSAVEYAVTNPVTGEKVKTFDLITDDALRDAIKRADEARGSWARETSVEERAKIIARAAQLHSERSRELAQIITREMGKPVNQAVGEIGFSAAIYEYYANNAPTLLADEPVELPAGEGSAVLRRRPLGVLLRIRPWTFRSSQVAGRAGPNLMARNPILLKHAPQCPESSAFI